MDGVAVRTLASHHCGPGLIPGLCFICEYSCLLVLWPFLVFFLDLWRPHENQPISGWLCYLLNQSLFMWWFQENKSFVFAHPDWIWCQLIIVRADGQMFLFLTNTTVAWKRSAVCKQLINTWSCIYLSNITTPQVTMKKRWLYVQTNKIFRDFILQLWP
jgi:hypothetical protein